MDGNRFDTLVASLTAAGSSRRSLLGRLAAGGFAAALATLGIGRFNAGDAEAKSCQKKCKKKNSKQSRRKCKKRCKKKGGGGGGGGSAAGFRIVSLSDVGEGCTSSATCDTGFCRFIAGIGTCQVCDVLLTCGAPGDQQCCVIGASCVNGVCIL